MEMIDDVLLLLGYLDDVEPADKNGYFLLPRSKENLIHNLQGFTNQPTLIARKLLTEILAGNEKNVDLHTKEFVYHARYSKARHGNQGTKCFTEPDRLRESEETIELKNRLLDESKKAYDSYEIDLEKAYGKLASKVRNVRDLIQILLLKLVVKYSFHGLAVEVAKSYRDSGPLALAFKETRTVLAELETSSRVLDRLFSDNTHVDVRLLESLKGWLLDLDKRSFVTLNAHDFNTSSCQRRECLYVNRRWAEYLHMKLKKLSAEESIYRTYTLVVRKFEGKYGKPLFGYKCGLLQLLEIMVPKIRREERIFLDGIEEYMTEIDKLATEETLGLEGNQVIVKDEQRLEELHKTLLESEERQLDGIVSLFVKEWLAMGIKGRIAKEKKKEEDKDTVKEKEKAERQKREEEKNKRKQEELEEDRRKREEGTRNKEEAKFATVEVSNVASNGVTWVCPVCDRTTNSAGGAFSGSRAVALHVAGKIRTGDSLHKSWAISKVGNITTDQAKKQSINTLADQLEWYVSEENAKRRQQENELTKQLAQDGKDLGQLIESKAVKGRLTYQNEKRVRDLGDDVVNLVYECNQICSSKKKDPIFSVTTKMLKRTLDLSKAVSNRDHFGNFIDSLYEIIYEGSGCLKRIPETIKQIHVVCHFIGLMRMDLRHDLDHGDEREVEQKKERLASAYLKYSGKTSLISLSDGVLTGVQINVLEDVKRLLKELKEQYT